MELIVGRIGMAAYRLLKTLKITRAARIRFTGEATAMEEALTLATINRKHVQLIEGLQPGVPAY